MNASNESTFDQGHAAFWKERARAAEAAVSIIADLAEVAGSERDHWKARALAAEAELEGTEPYGPPEDVSS